MSRTLLIVIITAIVVVLFVISRFVTYDISSISVSKPYGNKKDNQFESWIPFTSKNESFSVKVPREPEHASQTTPDTFNRSLKHYEIYAINGIDNTAYLIQEITFLKGLSPDKDPEILIDTLKDIAVTTGSTIVESDENSMFLGNKAVKFILDKNQKRTQGVMFVQGKVLYIISKTVNQNSKNQDDDYQYFLDSFEIKQK